MLSARWSHTTSEPAGILQSGGSGGEGGAEERLIEVVNVLAVPPGCGGCSMSPSALLTVQKLAALAPHLKHLSLDGGVNCETAQAARQAGANMVIAGSAVFGRQRCVSQGYAPVRANLSCLIQAFTSDPPTPNGL